MGSLKPTPTDVVDKHVLYYHRYSICSLQVLYTLAIGSAYVFKDGSHIQVERRFVDVFNSAQLDETFLTEINPKGQVPVLKPPNLQRPIADSLLITYYCMDIWPHLAPEPERATIIALLEEIHALNYFTLTFPDRPQIAEGLVHAIEKQLARSDISVEYRNALVQKLELTVKEKLNGIKPESILENEQRARILFLKLESYLQHTPWLLGLSSPTALDAHTVILIGRLQDVGRTGLVPARLLGYADKAFATKELQDVMEGRRTMLQPL